MTWQRLRGLHARPSMFETYRESPFNINNQCYIRKGHECGKAYAASKSCFIACPTDENLEPTLELISEKLMRHGIEPIIAVKERAYGQDIFCTKICGKIIESKFCIAILDDTIEGGKNVPNPNVYYEYGLMTSLGKHIIPLQKADQKLAFNIQSYDTIKYTPVTLGGELERAIRDAIRITEEPAAEDESAEATDRMIMRRFEIAGWVAKDHNWFLSSVIADTQFRGLESDSEKTYLYLGKIDAAEDARSYLEDLDVIVVRTEKKLKELGERHAEIVRKLSEAKADQELGKLGRYFLPYKLEQMVEELPAIESKLENARTIFVAFIVAPNLELNEFRSCIESATASAPRLKVSFSSDGTLKLGSSTVEFAVPGK